MTVRVNKDSFNIREKLSELERPIGLKGSELMRAETAQEARDFVSAGRKNLVINGAMEIAQRSTSVTGSTAAGAYLSVDRFANHASGGTYNSSQEVVTVGGMSGLPIKFKNYFRFDVTTGANNCGIWQTIEDIRTVQGEHTFSFYARGINPGGGSLEIDTRQYFSGSGDIDTIIGDMVLTDVWQRFTFTFTPPSLSGKTIGSNSYYRLFIRQPDSDNSTNAWRIDITGVQLEVGKNATDFEHRFYGEELALCQRYCYVIRGDWPAATAGVVLVGNGVWNGTNNAYITIQHPVTMLKVPAIAYGNLGWYRVVAESVSWRGISSLTLLTDSCSINSTTINIAATSDTRGLVARMTTQTTSAILILSSEL